MNHFMSMLEKLSFENCFHDLKSHMISFRIVKNLFQSNENVIQENVQLELID